MKTLVKIIIFSLTIDSIFAVKNETLPQRLELIIPDNGLFYFNKNSLINHTLSIPENIEMDTRVLVISSSPNEALKKTFTLSAGNTEDNFKINSTTGEIRVNKFLDYENINNYNLTISVFAGAHSDNTTIAVLIENINDNPPKFEDFNKEITIVEETLPSGDCLIIVKAYDPDIANRSENQHIIYTLSDTNHFSIDKTGCLKMSTPLDRDRPNGKATWEVIINAHDDENSEKSLEDFIKISINLLDINDNKPFLINSSSIWDENQVPGVIKKLVIDDYDSSINAGPFNISIDYKKADKLISSRFSIDCSGNLIALAEFDREEKEEYIIPLIISDNGNPSLTTKTNYNIIIGDVNDIKMKNSTKSVVIRNWDGNYVDLQYLFVDVNDDDDGWHLNDYHFIWNGVKPDNFDLDPRTGTIIPVKGITSGNYHLKFHITEESDWIAKHTVSAIVDVTFKEISKDAYFYLKNHGDNSICPEYLDC